jgi:hypothetical protein
MVKDPAPARDIDPNITPELQEILYRSLEGNPKAQYSSAREFCQQPSPSRQRESR